MRLLKSFENWANRLIPVIFELIAPENAKIKKLMSIEAGMMRDLLPKSPVQMKDVTALFDYRNKVVKMIIRSIKYKNNWGLRKRIAGYLCDEATEIFSETALFEGAPPILAPMPMSKREKRKRGFNQCEELAKEMKKLAGSLEISFDILKKVRETGKQADLGKEERMKNVEGSMAAPRQMARGRVVVILDDVYTTGATFSEARRALSAAGAKRVLGLFIAH